MSIPGLFGPATSPRVAVHRYPLMAASRLVPVLVGPTASGKTSVGIVLSEILAGEIISADSRQIYKLMDIGTAKPTRAERARVRHHFVDVLLPGEYFSAGEFGRKGRECVEEIFRQKRQPVVVGGSGLYIQALIDGFFKAPPHDEELRKQLYRRLHAEGSDSLVAELTQVDPISAAKMLPSNTRRIVRALEVYYLTGIPVSRHHKEQRIQRSFEPVFFGLEWDRRKLYERINARVEAMMENGLVDEVRLLQRKGCGPTLNALQTVGYVEVFQYLNREISRERMVELIKLHSRHYAKRQLSWFRRDKRIRWLAVQGETEFHGVAGEIARLFRTARQRSA